MRRGRERKAHSALFTGVVSCPEGRHFPSILFFKDLI